MLCYARHKKSDKGIQDRKEDSAGPSPPITSTGAAVARNLVARWIGEISAHCCRTVGCRTNGSGTNDSGTTIANAAIDVDIAIDVNIAIDVGTTSSAATCPGTTASGRQGIRRNPQRGKYGNCSKRNNGSMWHGLFLVR